MWKYLQPAYLPFKKGVYFPKNVPTLTTSFFRHLFIQTETTPAEHSLKFKPGLSLLSSTQPSIEVNSMAEAQRIRSPMSVALFNVPGIDSVFYGPDFITVTKAFDYDWSTVKPHVFSILTDYLSQHIPLVEEGGEETGGKNPRTSSTLDTALHPEDSEVVAMIKELIASRIRPTIQDDGGDVEYCGFDETQGVVYLRLKGACRTCESSVVTLKKGIQNMLQYFIPEVKSVKQLEDEAFEDFEKSLAQTTSSTSTTSS
ncbi:hypothetical protein HMI54_005658 [Coelomomyces lativittatus]|nr:hypothetical protein HMI55_003068 [Coelomomyces lativittatus]KAJ1504620.1 hypothetical protein HMI56_001539 [Coelomomyces lativittatus]KAJ1505774.1 hypothetical protein HMI54_005658 [Coelomomyces lativittatus]